MSDNELELSSAESLPSRPWLTRATTSDCYGFSETQPSTPSGPADLPTPTSALLQNLLRERKQYSRRNSQRSVDSSAERRRRSSSADVVSLSVSDRDSYFVDSANFIQSSPMAPRQDVRSLKPDRRLNPLGHRVVSGPRGMGIRQMDEHMSKLHKQIFDLKLEVFHRRERAALLERKLEEALNGQAHNAELEACRVRIRKLESRLLELSKGKGRLKRLEADNAELQDINEQLLNELEKRDAAVHDAVNIISALEDKLSKPSRPVFSRAPSLRDAASILESKYASSLPLKPAASRSSVHTAGSRHSSRVREDFQSPLLEASSSPSTKTSITVPLSLRGSSRTPSLRKPNLESESTSGATPSRDAPDFDPFSSPDTLEDEILHSPKSPQLSVLSESSFLSVYGRSPSPSLPNEGENEVYDDDDDDAAEENASQGSLDGSLPSLPVYTNKDGDDVESIRTTIQMKSSSRAEASLARARKYLDDKATPTRSFRVTHPKIYQHLGDIIYRNSSLVTQGVRAPNSIFKDSEGYSSSPDAAVPHRRIQTSVGTGLTFRPEILPPTPDTMSIEGSLSRRRSNSSALTEKNLTGSKASTPRRSSLDPRPLSSSSAAMMQRGNRRLGSNDHGRAPVERPRPNSFYSESSKLAHSGTDAQLAHEPMHHLSRFNGMPPPPALRPPFNGMASPNAQSGPGSETRAAAPRAKKALSQRGRSPPKGNVVEESPEMLRPRRQRAATTDGSNKRPSLTARILGRFA